MKIGAGMTAIAMINVAVYGNRQGGKMEDVQRAIEKVRTDIQDGKSDEEIFRSLQTFLGKDLETDKKVAELLVSIPDVRVAKLLQRMLGFFKEKKIQKTIKRSLYRLKSRGIAIEEVILDEGRPILYPLKTELPKGHASSIDFIGNRLLLLVIPRVGRGLTVMQGVISDTNGLVDFSGEEMARKEFIGFFEKVQKNTPFPFVEMDPSYVAFLYAQAYRLTLKQRRTLPQDYLLLKSDIEGIKREYEKALVYSYLQIDKIAGDDGLLKKAESLLKNDLFSGWGIDQDQIQPYADAIREAGESKIILSQAQKEVRFQEVYLRALSELFSDEKRVLYRQRLEEMAYVLFKLGRSEEAEISLAVAIDLEKPINPIQPNAFLYQLVIKSISALLAEAYEKEKKEPSLIVKP